MLDLCIIVPSSPSLISKTEVGGYAFYATGTTLYFDIRVNGSYRTVSYNYASKFNEWHHIAATFDGQATRLYIDTAYVAVDFAHITNTYPIQYGYQNALIIGGEASVSGASNGNFFNGSMDEVRIWNYARSQDSIVASRNRELNGTESGLVGYWNFNEGSGSTAADQTSNHHDGTLTNSPVWIGSGPALPVELSSFTVVPVNGTAILSWRTESETDNHGFDIEKRRPDGPLSNTWERIAFVPGHGTSASVHDYSYVDERVTAGRSVYRLRQIDRDGSFSYSSEVSVTEENNPSRFALMQNHPNPFNPSTTISYQLSEPGSVTLTVYDMLGREIAVLVNEVQNAGVHTVTFNARSRASGLYFYTLHTKNNIATKRMNLLQ